MIEIIEEYICYYNNNRIQLKLNIKQNKLLSIKYRE
ncbi:IS3 family transposase [Gottschalkia purinilytica]